MKSNHRNARNKTTSSENKEEVAAISRRGFLKWSSLLASATFLAGSTGCGFEEADEKSESDPGRWVPAQCWQDCGGRGFNKVYVKDGKAVLMGTDKTVEDTPGCPQLRSCARGRANRSHIFSADRLKYPMKRKNWEPGGGDRSLRGKDEWERITWDEALDYIAEEIKRITSKYGNEAILVPGCLAAHFGQWDIGRMLCLHGGYMATWGATSEGPWGVISHYIGFHEDGNDRLDMLNSQLIILWGQNTAWSRGGQPSYEYRQCKENGTRFIAIDPFRHPMAQVVADEWLPVRPGTDTALAMGMAHVMFKEDEAAENTLIDWDFIDRCTVGFDAKHLPDGADPADCFKDYVLGTYDGIPKTPEWASEICGTPVDQIESVAKEILSTERVSIRMSPAPSRTTNGYTVPQTMLALGAMAGCIGKPGCMVSSDSGHLWLYGGPRLVSGGTIVGQPTWATPGGKEMITNPIGGLSPNKFTGITDGVFTRPLPPYTRINNNELWTSIMTGKYTAGKGDIRDCKTQMIYSINSNMLNQMPGAMLGIEAFRKIEFVVTQNITMTTTALYADIVLPITTHWERVGEITGGYREQIMYTAQVTEPMFEAKDDIWVAEELSKRIGVDVNELTPCSQEQELFNQMAAATVLNEDGKTSYPLLTFTQEDVDDLGVEGQPQEGRLPYKKFVEDGIYQVPRKEGDNYGYISLGDFREDPEANPRGNKTGKLEIYCKELPEDLEACGWGTSSPGPKYVSGAECYEETFSDWATKTKGEYPFQLISEHHPRFAHSQFGNIPILREAFDHPLYMNKVDGEDLGLKTGETVLITSKWGKSLRPLLLVDYVMPGVLLLGQGAWVDIDEETGIDKAGSINVLFGPNASAFGHQATGSCIVKVEKWTGTTLIPDAEIPAREMF